MKRLDRLLISLSFLFFIYMLIYCILAIFHSPIETKEKDTSMVITDRSWAANLTHLLLFSDKKVHFEPEMSELSDTIIFIGHGNFHHQFSSGIYYCHIKAGTIIENYSCSGKDINNRLQIIKGNNSEGNMNVFEIFLIKWGVINLITDCQLWFIYVFYYVYFIALPLFRLLKIIQRRIKTHKHSLNA